MPLPPRINANQERSESKLLVGPKRFQARDTARAFPACAAIRFSYGCSGDAYDKWKRENAARYWSMFRAAREPLHREIMFIGNSHTGQLAEAFLCAHRQSIVAWSGTDLATGCLSPRSLLDPPCSGNRECGVYLAQAQLETGVRIHTVINHPYMYQDAAGMRAILHALAISRLDAIVIGNVNTLAWANDVFVKRHIAYPHPALEMPCGAVVHANESRHTQLRMPTPDEMTTNLLRQLRVPFNGTLILGGMFNRSPMQFGQKMPIHKCRLDLRADCTVPNCSTGASSPHAHVCMPGPPDLLVGNIRACIGMNGTT